MSRYEDYQARIDEALLDELPNPQMQVLSGTLKLTKSNSTAIYLAVTIWDPDNGGIVNQVYSVKNSTPASFTGKIVVFNGMISVAQLTTSTVTVTGDGVISSETKAIASSHRTTNIYVGDLTKDITVAF